jgi:leader peptidase (prepilin peptidase) / N-methyltransferase
MQLFLMRSETGNRRLLWTVALIGAYATLAYLMGPVGTAELLLRTIALGIALIVLSLIDIETCRLPDWLTLPLIGVGCMLAPSFTLPDIAWHVASAAAGYLSLYLVAEAFKRYRGYPGLGLGDAKLFAAAGAWLGMEDLPLVLAMASLLALAAAAAAYVAGMAIDRQTRLPFGPFLAFAIWTTWLIGPASMIG